MTIGATGEVEIKQDKNGYWLCVNGGSYHNQFLGISPQEYREILYNYNGKLNTKNYVVYFKNKQNIKRAKQKIEQIVIMNKLKK
jgi:hypothetical protein